MRISGSLHLGASAPGVKTICLSMIVKNEAGVIRRCLESVKTVIDSWVICDTGSTDETSRIIRETLAGIPGELHEIPWTNFGDTRTRAMALTKGKADYHLLLDADMTLSVSKDVRDTLVEDSYFLQHEGDCQYWIERLLSDRFDWHFVGPTHEFIACEKRAPPVKLKEWSVIHHEDGGSRQDKYQRDIRLLKEALENDPGNARNTFYLAQSYRDIGNFQQAIEWYETRASMDGWEEETWYAAYQVARLQHQLGFAWAIVLQSYLTAFQLRRTRAEPLYYIARFYRENQQDALADLFGRRAAEIPYPEDILFIEKDIYASELRTEIAQAD